MDQNQPIFEILLLFKAKIKERYGSRFKRLILFGSYARGDQRIESDIDMMLVLDSQNFMGAKEISQIMDIITDFLLEYGYLISIVPTTDIFFGQNNRLLYREVKTEGIEL
jgi:uncharacterized protein